MGNWAFYVICPVEASSHCVTPLHCINGQLPEITPYSLGGASSSYVNCTIRYTTIIFHANGTWNSYTVMCVTFYNNNWQNLMLSAAAELCTKVKLTEPHRNSHQLHGKWEKRDKQKRKIEDIVKLGTHIVSRSSVLINEMSINHCWLIRPASQSACST